jgi:hypothetical protein
LPWPQQTLTALAVETEDTSGFITATPEATPTKYYTLSTPTQKTAGGGDEGGGFGSMQESETKSGQPVQDERSGLLSNIPTTWLLLLLVPITLIVVGVYLELRDREKESQPAPSVALGDRLDFGSKKEEKDEDGPEEESEDDVFGDFDMYDFGQG